MLLTGLADRLATAADRADDVALFTEAAAERLRLSFPRLSSGALRLTATADDIDRALRRVARGLRELDDFLALLRVDVRAEQEQSTLDDARDFP